MSKFHRHLGVLFTNHLLKVKSEKHLKDVIKWTPTPNNEGVKKAAVLCCLREYNGEVSVLINKRSNSLSRSPGDPSFPGGMVDAADCSLEDTALREAEEEINLKREQVKTVAILPPSLYGSRENIVCSTVVCSLATEDTEKLNLQAQKEVDEILWVPLKIFLGGHENHWQKQVLFRKKWPVILDYFRIPEHSNLVVWGLTARLCIIVASIVYSRPPSFPFVHVYVSSLDPLTMNIFAHTPLNRTS